MYEIAAGSVTAKNKFWIQMDIKAAWDELNGKTGNNVEIENAKEKTKSLMIVENPIDANKFNPLDMRQVFSRTPSVQDVKSLVEQVITLDEEGKEPSGHMLLMSAKFHCECAGVGIEYCFGRVKWWYNKFHRHTSDGLREDSEASFLPGVVSLHHMRKFARKARDYMRVYRAGITGVKADGAVKLVRTHRCAMDTDLVFVSGGIVGAPVDYNK